MEKCRFPHYNIRMDQDAIERALAGVPLGPIHYLDRVSSTNDVALDWMEAGAPDLCLVVADEQTRGRGRSGRTWYTPPGVALAMSFGLLHDLADGDLLLPRFTALGALAAAACLHERFALEATIKWPNDVLLHNQKVAGVLAEARWAGTQLTALTVGIGINLAPGSVPPPDRLAFPAVDLETVVGKRIDRLAVLASMAAHFVRWRPKIASAEFLTAWESRLAYRGQHVWIESEGQKHVEGRVLGLSPEGALRLALPDGHETDIRVGDLRLRPHDSVTG